MITYVAKSSIISVSDVATLLVAADRDRIHLELLRSGAVYVGGADVAFTSGYITASGTPIRLEGTAATAAVYGITESGSASISVLEVVPDL